MRYVYPKLLFLESLGHEYPKLLFFKNLGYAYPKFVNKKCHALA